MRITSLTHQPDSSELQVPLPGARYRRHGISPFPYHCGSNVNFWRPYINGTSFTDCRAMELNHYWSAPPCHPVPLITIANHANRKESYGGLGIEHTRSKLGTLTGLKKIESLSLEYVMELDESVLQTIFRSRMAESLKILELRYCNIDHVVLAELMEGALPILTHFTFLDRMESARAESSRYALAQNDPSTAHLCPRIRDFGKNLHHLDFAVPYVCRDMFVSGPEVEVLSRAGIATDVGTPEGEIAVGMSLDRHAIQQVLSEHRQKQSRLRKRAFVIQAVSEAKASNSATGTGPKSGASSTQIIELNAARDAEYSYEQEECKRARTILETKGGWT